MNKKGNLTPEDLRWVARFRGHPIDPVQKRWEPKKMDALIHRALGEFSVLKEERPEQIILKEWKTIVGDAMASHCTPARILPEGTLIVLVPNPIQRQELSFQKRAILRRIRFLKGCRHIQRILLRGG